MNPQQEIFDYAQEGTYSKRNQKKYSPPKFQFEIHGLNSFQVEEDNSQEISNSGDEESDGSIYKKETKGFLNTLDMCINEFENRNTALISKSIKVKNLKF